MLWQVIVKLMGDLVYFGQVGAWDVREVVVLHVVANVPGQDVPRPVI